MKKITLFGKKYILDMKVFETNVLAPLALILFIIAYLYVSNLDYILATM